MDNFFEKTLESEPKFIGKVVKVYCDKILLPNDKISYREIIKHMGGVVIVCENKKKEIVFVRQFRYAVNKHTLELPAGKLEEGEEPLNCAIRELEEECGYVAKTWESLGFIYTSPGILSEKLYLFKASNLDFVGAKPDDNEFLSCKYINVNDVFEKIKSSEINDAKSICALMRAYKV